MNNYLNRDTIRRLLDKNLFDVHSAILSDAGEPNKYVPEQNIRENHSEESYLSSERNLDPRVQGKC